MSIELDRTRIAEIVEAIADRLPGEFLLIGGALVALWIEPRRVTEDIDIIGFDGDSRQRLALMDLAHDLGLPIEAVNSAADFFVFRVPDWRDQIVPFKQGARGMIYRPTATLFLLLKVGRLSETDLDDCLGVIAQKGPEIDRARVLAALARDQGDEGERRARVERLREALQS